MPHISRANSCRRVAALLLLSFLGIAAASDPEPVRVGGTGSGSVLMQRLAQEYLQVHPGARVIVIMPPLSSGGGIRALSAGKIDLAVVGRPLKAEEAAMPGLGRPFEFVRTPLVFASNGIQGAALSQKQLADIYSGRLVNWPDGSPIRLVLRSKAESDTLVMRAISPEMDAAIDVSYRREGMLIADNDIDTFNLLVRTPGSFGPTTMGMLRLDGRQLTVTQLDGVNPSVKTMTSGRYPCVKSIYLLPAATPRASLQEFLAFLHSDKARRFLEEAEIAVVSTWKPAVSAK